MTTPLPIDGIDMSHYQSGMIDYEAAKKAGVKFIYEKATEGLTYVDPFYAKRRAEAKKHGIPFGAYHFAQPHIGDARAEARRFLAVANPVPGDLLPALDLETYAAGMTQTDLTRWVGNFVREVRKDIGVTPVIYTRYNLNRSFKARLWEPRYSNTNTKPVVPSPWKKYDIWQFSNGVYGNPHTVPGLGKVDINTLNGISVSDLIIPPRKRRLI